MNRRYRSAGNTGTEEQVCTTYFVEMGSGTSTAASKSECKFNWVVCLLSEMSFVRNFWQMTFFRNFWQMTFPNPNPNPGALRPPDPPAANEPDAVLTLTLVLYQYNTLFGRNTTFYKTLVFWQMTFLTNDISDKRHFWQNFLTNDIRPI